MVAKEQSNSTMETKRKSSPWVKLESQFATAEPG